MLFCLLTGCVVSGKEHSILKNQYSELENNYNKLKDLNEQELVISMKIKCNDMCINVFEEDKEHSLDIITNPEQEDLMLTPAYTYSKGLNTCLYAGGKIYPRIELSSHWIKDCFTREVLLGLSMIREGSGEKSITNAPFCGNNCVSSREEFNKKKQEFFNE